MKICHFGHINKNHSPIKYTYLFPRQDSREMKIQRPKLKHCSHVYSDNKVFQITDDMICGEATGQDACQGDSGGPFTVEVDFGHDQ